MMMMMMMKWWVRLRRMGEAMAYQNRELTRESRESRESREVERRGAPIDRAGCRR
jgi:hypothetical protein